MIGEMWTGMALTGKAIIAILGLLSVYSMAVVVERFVALRWATRSSRAFASEVEGITDAGAMRERATAPDYADFASLAHVVGGSLEEYDRIRAEEDDGDLIIEAVEDATMRQVDVAVINLRARLTSMATVSGVAPFLGLFGTVTGLISAFNSSIPVFRTRWNSSRTWKAATWSGRGGSCGTTTGSSRRGRTSTSSGRRIAIASPSGPTSGASRNGNTSAST